MRRSRRWLQQILACRSKDSGSVLPGRRVVAEEIDQIELKGLNDMMVALRRSREWSS